MGRFFLPFLITAIVTVLLFVPIVVESDTHADLNAKKLTFCICLYGKIKIIGGYVSAYPGGIVLHVKRNKAILLPYSGMNEKRKKFSFVKTFKVRYFSITTETGAEYLLPVSIAHTTLKALFYAVGGKHEHSNLWLKNGDTLKIAVNVVAWFNLFTLLKEFIKFLKEKMQCIIRKKTKKSTV